MSSKMKWDKTKLMA